MWQMLLMVLMVSGEAGAACLPASTHWSGGQQRQHAVACDLSGSQRLLVSSQLPKMAYTGATRLRNTLSHRRLLQSAALQPAPDLTHTSITTSPAVDGFPQSSGQGEVQLFMDNGRTAVNEYLLEEFTDTDGSMDVSVGLSGRFKQLRKHRKFP